MMMSATKDRRPRIAVTLGDLSGVGPELVVRLLADRAALSEADVYVLASQAEVDAICTDAGVRLPTAADPGPEAVALAGSSHQDQYVPRGVVSRVGGERALADLEAAVEMYRRDDIDGILFAPLNKSALALAGMAEEDELRWLAKKLEYAGSTSELNLVPGLTTSRVTSHIPLKEVSSRINSRSVAEAIRLLDGVIRGFGADHPRLAVCALNPHAGEGGKFGSEEADHIGPAISLVRNEGIDASGPFPCDTLFIKARDGDYDGVVTMYHDQGQIAMKLMGFDKGVTVQGGLPVPIATPAHGTAHGIVGKGVANTTPMQRAFSTAVALARQKMTATSP